MGKPMTPALMAFPVSVMKPAKHPFHRLPGGSPDPWSRRKAMGEMGPGFRRGDDGGEESDRGSLGNNPVAAKERQQRQKGQAEDREIITLDSREELNAPLLE